MSNFKGTPGPWVSVPGEDGGRDINGPGSANYIASVHGGYEPSEECLANARLIAAAPGMLRTLQWLLDEQILPEKHEWDVKLVIAKATTL
jgi:hypothetical protein